MPKLTHVCLTVTTHCNVLNVLASHYGAAKDYTGRSNVVRTLAALLHGMLTHRLAIGATCIPAEEERAVRLWRAVGRLSTHAWVQHQVCVCTCVSMHGLSDS